LSSSTGSVKRWSASAEVARFSTSARRRVRGC
jgi:hypothetical protein